MKFDKYINTVLESVNETHIGLLGGGFKPPHKGHYHLFEKLAEASNEVRIFIGKKPRTSSDGMVFDQELSKRVWEFYIQNDPRINIPVEIIFSKITPIKDVYEVVENAQPGDNIYIATSTKQEEGGPGDMDRYKNLQKYVPEGSTAELFPVEPLASNLGQMSATEFRDAIVHGDEEIIEYYLPQHINNVSEFLNILTWFPI